MMKIPDIVEGVYIVFAIAVASWGYIQNVSYWAELKLVLICGLIAVKLLTAYLRPREKGDDTKDKTS